MSPVDNNHRAQAELTVWQALLCEMHSDIIPVLQVTNQGTEMLGDMPKVTQLVRAEITPWALNSYTLTPGTEEVFDE